MKCSRSDVSDFWGWTLWGPTASALAFWNPAQRLLQKGSGLSYWRLRGHMEMSEVLPLTACTCCQTYEQGTMDLSPSCKQQYVLQWNSLGRIHTYSILCPYLMSLGLSFLFLENEGNNTIWLVGWLRIWNEKIQLTILKHYMGYNKH